MSSLSFAARPRPARWLAVIFIAALALTLLVGASPAFAAAGAISEFPLPAAGLAPGSITAGPDGALWFNENAAIGRATTAGALAQFAHPTGNSITSGPDGALWFTEPSKGLIGRVTTSGAFSDFALPGDPDPADPDRIPERPQSITAGPDGNLWFTVQLFNQVCNCVLGGKIGRITTSGAITEFTLPTGGTRRTSPKVTGITAGPDGALWFVDSNLRKIGRMTTAGALTQFNVPSGSPQGITAGPDGNLWFTANAGTAALVGRLTTAGAFSTFTVATDPDNISIGPAIVPGPDGNLWTGVYPTLTAVGTILRVTPAGAVARFPLKAFDSVNGIAKGPDGAMWFTVTHIQDTSSAVGRIAVQ